MSASRMSDRVRSPLVRAGLALLAALSIASAVHVLGSASGDGGAMAFDRTWGIKGCTSSVATSHRGLIDDAPGAGANNDAALAYVKADDSTQETCVWRTNVTIDNTLYRSITVRAAVNDGTRLRVETYTGADCTGTLLSATAWPIHAAADSSFRTVSRTMTRGTIRSVCIVVGDQVATHAQRVSAILDRIRIHQGLVTTWQETFTKAG